MQHRDDARRRHLEDRAVTGGAALSCRPIEVPVGRLNKAGIWITSIRRTGERVKDGMDAAAGDFEDCPLRKKRAAKKRGSVEVAVGPLDDGGRWKGSGSIRAKKRVQHLETHLCAGDARHENSSRHEEEPEREQPGREAQRSGFH